MTRRTGQLSKRATAPSPTNLAPHLPPEARYAWEFKRRFRRRAFGWQSQPAIQRIKQAVSEIKRVARTDSALAAEGAVSLLERLSPALEQVDSSSGAIGSAVNHAIDALVPVIASAPVDDATREKWLVRLWNALEADKIPYIELLGASWGDLCASKERASQWADRLLEPTRLALSPDRTLHGFFHGTTACLSALHHAERYDLIVELLPASALSFYRDWAVKALHAMGREDAAVRYAEICDAGIRARHVRR